jgi:hypothetical protein
VEEDASQVNGDADGSPKIKDTILTIASKLNKDVEAVTTHLGNVETLQHGLLQQLAQCRLERHAVRMPGACCPRPQTDPCRAVLSSEVQRRRMRS